MKIIQKLELFFGIATLLAALLCFYFIVLPRTGQLEKLGYSNKEILLRALLGLILPAFLTLIGAYVHAAKRSIVGLIVIFIFAGMIVFLNAVSFLIGSAFGGYVLLGVSPGLFAAATILFAICSTILSESQPDDIKLRMK